ncbi:MAG: amino acid ABC transporter permease [Actinomycetota bacterium]
MKGWLRWAIGGGGAALILAALAAAAYRSYGPGDSSERLARLERRWSPFVGQGSGTIWKFIGQGVLVTLQIAAISIVLSLIFGTILALMRLARNPQLSSAAPRSLLISISAPAGLLVQIVRASPLYMLILYTFVAAPRLGLDLPAKVAGIIALTLYTSCVLAEIIRAGILSLDRGQSEASLALGLPYLSRLRLIILPQALRRMAPAVVSQLVTLIKDTSLLSFITVLEVSRRLAILSQQKFNPIESFLVAAMIYFCINLALSAAAARLQRAPTRVAAGAPVAIQQVGAEDQTRII